MQNNGLNKEASAYRKNDTDDTVLEDPYTVPYLGIYAVCDDKNERIELIERSDCFAGACWSFYHYPKSPLIRSARLLGESVRYMIDAGSLPLRLRSSVAAAGIGSAVIDPEKNEISVTFSGLGGAGIGATKCRASARGVLRYEITESGGEKEASGTLILPRRRRVLIAVDDTDSKEIGATWTLTHNIVRTVSCDESVFLSHSLVQLFPVPEKTQNCMSTILEFGCVSEEAEKKLIDRIRDFLVRYSATPETGMLVYTGFDVPEDLIDYSRKGRTMRLTKEKAVETAARNNVRIILNGNGVIGALSAFAWFAQPVESVRPGFPVSE